MASTFVEVSKNAKVGTVSATYTSIKASCPDTCALKGNGCYAETGYVGFTVRRLDAAGEGMTPLQVAKAEAAAIDASFNGGRVPEHRPLRLHVSGDARTPAAARTLAKAVDRWLKRSGGPVWAYTHAWRDVKRKDWGQVSVLASMEQAKDAEAAAAQGYVPAVVVEEFPSDKAFTLPGSEVQWIPCVAQTTGRTCTECKLCFNDSTLRRQGKGIAFAAHGARTKAVKRQLKVIAG